MAVRVDEHAALGTDRTGVQHYLLPLSVQPRELGVCQRTTALHLAVHGPAIST
jgi:hypothetical protein